MPNNLTPTLHVLCIKDNHEKIIQLIQKLLLNQLNNKFNFNLLQNKLHHMKVIRKTVISNKMTLYWWTHFFWVTAITTQMVLSSPIPFTSLETISTSLKSALVQNDNSFQQTGDQQKITSGKSVVPLTFETSDSDDLFGVADQINAENIAKNNDWLPMHEQSVSNKNLNESASSTEKPKSISVKLEQSIPSSADVIASSVNETNNSNKVNSTNTSQITTVATTMLTNIDESNNR